MPFFAEVDGVVLHYERQGPQKTESESSEPKAIRSSESAGRAERGDSAERGGPTESAIVFINALGCDLRIWDSVVERLPPDSSFLRFDKRGHGLSETGNDSVSIERFADDLAALMEICGIRNALVCGISVGGLIAQSLAVSRPDLVGSLVLCCTGLRIGDVQSWNDRIESVREGGVGCISEAVLERWFSSGFRREGAEELRGYRIMLEGTRSKGYVRACEALRDCDLAGQADSVLQPALCVAGSEDQATPPSLMRELAEALPNASYKELEGIAHLPCIESPDAIVEALLRS